MLVVDSNVCYPDPDRVPVEPEPGPELEPELAPVLASELVVPGPVLVAVPAVIDGPVVPVVEPPAVAPDVGLELVPAVAVAVVELVELLAVPVPVAVLEPAVAVVLAERRHVVEPAELEAAVGQTAGGPVDSEPLDITSLECHPDRV